MRFARPKSRVWTFRFRLMVWNAAAVMAVGLLTILGIRTGLQYTLFAEKDQVLYEDLREIQLTIVEDGGPPSDRLYADMIRKSRAHSLKGWYVRFLDPRGPEIWASPGAPPLFASGDAIPDWTPVSLNHYRIVQFVARPRGSPSAGVVIRVGSSLDIERHQMARLDGQGAILALVVVGISPLAGYWLAGSMMRPLEVMTESTGGLRPQQLQNRLPIRGSGDELDQLSRTINDLLDRIARYIGEKQDFLANAAHELRTPLAALRSAIDVALTAPRSAEEYEELLQGLSDECSALELLINQLLLLAETEAPVEPNARELVAWDAVVSKSIDMFEPVAEFQGLTLRFDAEREVFVRGNRHHLRQIVNNLLDNALKYTPAGGTVDVRLRRDAATSQAELIVRDTGAGISEEDLPRVFDRFFRGDRSRRRDASVRGTGLGLSIVEAVVRGHGGTIHVASRLGEGVTVSVRLPLAAPTPGGVT